MHLILPKTQYQLTKTYHVFTGCHTLLGEKQDGIDSLGITFDALKKISSTEVGKVV